MSQSLRQYCKAVLNDTDYKTLVDMVLERVGRDMFTEETCEILNDNENSPCQIYATALISLWAAYQYSANDYCGEFKKIFEEHPDQLCPGYSKYAPNFGSIVNFILLTYC